MDDSQGITKDVQLDIIIASFGKDSEMPSFLRLCLESIAAFTPIRYRIILERSTKSASENRNNGLDKASAPFICFLDDDTWVTPDWYKEPLEILKNNPNAIVGSIIKLESGQFFNCGIQFYPPISFIPSEYSRKGEWKNKDEEIAAIPTTALFATRESLKDVRFDESYTDCQWEDLDFFLKLKTTGCSAHMCSSSIVYHAHMFRGKSFDSNYELFKQKWSLPLTDLFAEQFSNYFTKCFVQIDAKNEEEVGYRLIRQNENGIRVFINYGNDFVYKMSHSTNTELLFEYRLLTTYLKESRFVPKILYKHPPINRAEIHGFVIPFYPCDEWDKITTTNLMSIGSAMAKVHALNYHCTYPLQNVTIPVLFGGHTFWIGGAQLLQKRLNKYETGEITIQHELSTIITSLLDQKENYLSLFDLTKSTIIHGDLSRENIRFKDQDVVFIDWGEAAIGSLANDLTHFCVEARLSEENRELFINAYISAFKESTSIVLDVNEIYEQISHLEPLIILDIIILGELAKKGSDPKDLTIWMNKLRESLTTLGITSNYLNSN